MTAPISGFSPLPPKHQTTPAEPIAKAVAQVPVATPQKLATPASTFDAAPLKHAARSAMPALLGGVADVVAQKSLGKQALVSNALDLANRSLAAAQTGLELAANVASLSQFGGLKAQATNALAGVAAQMPMNIANRVAGAINGGTDLHQVDVLQGIAHTQGPLAAGSLEAGPYSAGELGQYGAPTGDMGQYADPASQLGQLFGAAEMAGGAADLASGVGDLADLRDSFRKPGSKPSSPDSKPPSSPDGKPSSPEARPTSGPDGKTSTPDAKPSARPSTPDVKPGALAGKADDLAKTALKTGGKALSRFVPGANIAIAGLDIAEAVKTFKDPKASVGDKVTAGIVAGGSALAATNIPIVSQIGGAISTGASIAGEVVKNFGGAIKDTAKKVGEGIKNVAKDVGEGIKDTAKKVGEGIKDFFKGW